MSQGKEVATAPQHKGLLEVFGEKYNVPAKLVRETLQKTAFPDAKSDAEFIAMLTVANVYDLNPFLRQVYAFSSNGHVVPVVSVDGWIKVINEQETLESITFEYAEKKAVIGNSKPCFEWVECAIMRSDRELPIVVREYFDECYKNTPPWNGSPKRMLRHRALIQAGRLAFGLAFREPEDESRIREGYEEEAPDETPPEKPVKNADRARAAMKATPTPAEAQKAENQAPAPQDEVEDAEFEDVDEVTGEIVTPEELVDAIVEGEEGPFEVVPPERKSPVQAAAERAAAAMGLSMDAVEVEPEPEPATEGEAPVTARQAGTISAARSKYDWEPELFARLLSEFGVSEVKQLPTSKYAEFMQILRMGGQGATPAQEGLL